MNLVGPRPTSFPAERYAPWQRARLEVLPGMTGLWQVSRDREEGFDARVRLDLDYLSRRSIGLDVRILLATLPAVLRRRPAY
jgi:lipopolysaccharide/colanic/teichoic acid biosynthesis glycosyltransferase